MIETAVIPAAGYGSRMAPLTTVIPKEMYPLGHIPIIEHTIVELISSGMKRIGIVIRKGKEVIKEYLNGRKTLYKNVEFYFTYQENPHGLGDAMRRAKEFIGQNPFIMAIPDQILLSEKPATQQLLDAYKFNKGIWNAMVRIPKKDRGFFKGSRAFRCKRSDGKIYSIEEISTVEKSSLIGFGRTLYVSEALEYMTEKYINPETGEVDLLNTFQALKNHFPLYGIVLEGRPCDVGTWEGYYFYQKVILQHLYPYGKRI